MIGQRPELPGVWSQESACVSTQKPSPYFVDSQLTIHLIPNLSVTIPNASAQ